MATKYKYITEEGAEEVLDYPQGPDAHRIAALRQALAETPPREITPERIVNAMHAGYDGPLTRSQLQCE